MARLGCLEEWLDDDRARRRRAGGVLQFVLSRFWTRSVSWRRRATSGRRRRRRCWQRGCGGRARALCRWGSCRPFSPGRRWTRISGPSTARASAWCRPGRPGPFRMDVRWNAAVDRLTGAAERHSTACLEFRAGRGTVDWWFRSPMRRRATRWAEPREGRVPLAGRQRFRRRALARLGPRRSAGIRGRSLPEMILGAGERGVGSRVSWLPARTSCLGLPRVNRGTVPVRRWKNRPRNRLT